MAGKPVSRRGIGMVRAAQPTIGLHGFSKLSHGPGRRRAIGPTPLFNARFGRTSPQQLDECLPRAATAADPRADRQRIARVDEPEPGHPPRAVGSQVAAHVAGERPTVVVGSDGQYDGFPRSGCQVAVAHDRELALAIDWPVSRSACRCLKRRAVQRSSMWQVTATPSRR
ncbi:hypothetical protein [Cupriavidus taiwanensis]|uniref:hypothetical protein n=1 Tax=Cupriavidus taiwanensis TaxID=164546 RepID=UPI001E638BC2|nr:hypothetical protein [Cupriavidus taiwanensis]